MAVVGNVLSSESRIMSQDHSKLKNNPVSLKSKKSLLEHEMSKLEDQLGRAQKNQDVKGRQVVKDPRSENAYNLKELSMLRRSEEVVVLSSKLAAANLKKARLVRDFIPLVIKKLFESEHFNQALGDLQQKDYHPEAENIFDEAAEAFYELKFLYIPLLGEKAGQNLEHLVNVEAPSIQEASSS
uniref:Uncharacterized protein n=1 Tax=Tanacetum cinerariifolium TaxID=118510 RepID=A0A6L2NM46_TANCI|nr:hypothetical protein [Tanacetum cinerariifolium]